MGLGELERCSNYHLVEPTASSHAEYRHTGSGGILLQQGFSEADTCRGENEAGGSGQRLASMFEPPRELLFVGSFDEAKQQALEQQRWLVRTGSTTNIDAHGAAGMSGQDWPLTIYRI